MTLIPIGPLVIGKDSEGERIELVAQLLRRSASGSHRRDRAPVCIAGEVGNHRKLWAVAISRPKACSRRTSHFTVDCSRFRLRAWQSMFDTLPAPNGGVSREFR